MYNDQRAKAQAILIKQTASKHTIVASPSSALARALWLQDTIDQPIHYFLHQADWIANKAVGIWGISDEHNALKLGYDSIKECFPEWVSHLLSNPNSLPQVKKSAEFLGVISNALCKETHLPSSISLYIGTTDSTASCLAHHSLQSGQGITVLGSTLVVKLVTEQPVFNANYGIYSHRIGQLWLTGGASNSGGKVFLKYFDQMQLSQLTKNLHPDELLNLGYYPLLSKGERFPVSDTEKAPLLTPRPESNVDFFQAMLEGVSDIEVTAYQLLSKLSGTDVNNVITMGGGSANKAWQMIRQNKLQIPVKAASNTEAAYGSALLACRAHR